VGGIESVIASNKVVSTMERFKMREGKKERGAPRRQDSGDPQSFHELVYFYIHKSTCLGFSDSPPIFSPPSSFSFLGGLPFSVDWLEFLACWFWMVPTGLTKGE